MKAFQHWMSIATSEQQAELASRIVPPTSREMLYHYSSGFRKPSPDRAAEIERVTREMEVETVGTLHNVLRVELNDTCRRCEYARKCLGDAALSAASFEIVGEGKACE